MKHAGKARKAGFKLILFSLIALCNAFAPEMRRRGYGRIINLTSGIKDSEIHLHQSPGNDHHLDWLTSIKTRKDPAANAEVGHRSCSACLIAHAAMKLNSSLRWDPKGERFTNSEEANTMLSRKQRAPYGTDHVKRG